MALKAGRVGINPQDVDAQGHVKSQTPHTVDAHRAIGLNAFTPSSTASTAASAGWVFKTFSSFKVTHAAVYAKSTTVKWYITDSQGENVIAKTLTGLITGEWNYVELDEPVELEENKTYMVWCSNIGAKMAYKSNSLELSQFFLITGKAKYSTSENTKPDQTETGDNTYGVNMIIEI